MENFTALGANEITKNITFQGVSSGIDLLSWNQSRYTRTCGRNL